MFKVSRVEWSAALNRRNTQNQLQLVIDRDGTAVFSVIELLCPLVTSRSVAQRSVAQMGMHVQSPIKILFLVGFDNVVLMFDG